MTQSAAASVRIGELAPGTELIVDHIAYRHHGIYVGDGLVIHYTGWITCRRGLVEQVPLAQFAGRARILVARAPAESPLCRDSEDIVSRARSRLGERRYRLFSNNCEHFCNWCRLGESTSAQIDLLRKRAARIVRAVSRLWLKFPLWPAERGVRLTSC